MRPAIVRFADRLPLVFFAAATVTDPAPEPPPLTLTHVAPAALVVHAQPALVLTVTMVLPPVTGKEIVAGEMLYVHTGAPACSVTVMVCPATVAVAVR